MTSFEERDRQLLLHAALDGELDAAGAVEMERMLAADPELAAEYARLKALHKILQTHAPREEASAALRLRAMAMVDPLAPPQREEVKRDWRDPPSWRSFAAAIAATVVMTLGLDRLIATDATPDALTQAVLAAHLRGQISGQPVDVVSSDRHTVKPWLASKLPVAAAVVDLASEGFPLAGGRIDIVAGAGVPTLVYKRREHLISVTELRAGAGAIPATPRRRTLEGYSIIQWSDADRAYEVVSDLAPEELDAFVGAFRGALR
jgi:anti-sigma factor RsiW